MLPFSIESTALALPGLSPGCRVGCRRIRLLFRLHCETARIPDRAPSWLSLSQCAAISLLAGSPCARRLEQSHRSLRCAVLALSISPTSSPPRFSCVVRDIPQATSSLGTPCIMGLISRPWVHTTRYSSLLHSGLSISNYIGTSSTLAYPVVRLQQWSKCESHDGKKLFLG